MNDRWGLGPVFAYEWLIGSRSPRGYAIRVGFVLALLTVLVAIWMFQNDGKPLATIRDFAEAGAAFYQGLVGTQLVLVLLAAPAATAGAICLERSRGTLTHLLVTDLSDSEIVLGKLAARLVPTLSLVLCALPVQYLASFLGGIDPFALLGSTIVTLGVAIFACSLALTISVWGKKTQEVLIATYLSLCAWLLAYPTVLSFGQNRRWLRNLDPFQLAFAPYWSPGSVHWDDFLTFLGVMVAISMVLVTIAVLRFRPVAARNDRFSRVKIRREWRLFHKFSPSLDRNPVLWREWHRARPSRWSRTIWWVYYSASAIFSSLAVERFITNGGGFQLFEALVVGFEVSIGLLLLSVDSATSLAEERARGSLDILLTTPLTTRSIVLAKWRGTYRRVFSLAVLPVLVIAIGMEKGDRFLGMSIGLGLVLAYGAAITSLGLALATWVRRPGRAVALCVSLYAMVTVGLFFLVFAGMVPLGWEAEIAIGSPFYGSIYPLDEFDRSENNGLGLLCALGWGLFYLAIALSLLVGTIATFDRCMGRSRGGPGGSVPHRSKTSCREGERLLPGDGHLDLASIGADREGAFHD